MQAVLIKSPGGPEQIYLGQAPDPEIKDHQVLVKIKAAGVNRADTLQRMGQYPPPPGESEIMGLEMAGEVMEAGPGCERLKPGDKVFGILSGGGYAQYVALDEGLAMPIPEGIEFEQAAGMAEVFLTAYQALFWLGRLQPGENVLIHAGASGVGTAATQLAKQAGARILVTASSHEKLDACHALGADVGINYKQEDFPTRVMEATDNHGADVLVDFIAAPYYQRNLASMALDGRMVMLAFIGGYLAESVDLRPMLGKRITVMGTTLRSRTLDYRVRLSREFTAKYLAKFTTGEIKPVIDSVIPWSDVRAVHERIEANLNVGKIILRIS
ncbi:MAG: NAD(P)H-quinone oxidoreductase [Desulfarculaceae bacterium]|nr:NAD(P)H-quinone oxidoreductase [Desulfarculaceae bacterium]MCF8046291.1 NAD(P)H-quinone oxidoreductase [Desulfarculaceae bacterium]MCF8098734.1 NAD(P)H-quinone oxidoreductase [Desulfarculaceae bacterium]MCF8121641.1 NAD(P)H-quinone oxidoreductase [Desulfarculaceae bacterium]